MTILLFYIVFIIGQYTLINVSFKIVFELKIEISKIYNQSHQYEPLIWQTSQATNDKWLERPMEILGWAKRVAEL